MTFNNIIVSCSGVGREKRGIETFFEEFYSAISKTEIQSSIFFLTSRRSRFNNERYILTASRFSLLSRAIGILLRRSPYIIEQISSIPSVIFQIWFLRGGYLYTSEANLCMALDKLRTFLPRNFKLIYSNGAPMPGPFPWADRIHQVSPTYRDIALTSGESSNKHVFLPYGFNVNAFLPKKTQNDIELDRAHFGLPIKKRILISVGWISKKHKRMDYIINEVEKIPENKRPFLLLLGAIDRDSSEIIELAKLKLSNRGFSIRSVSPDEVSNYLRISDFFALGSLSEGFGRVYVEALLTGLPVISHDFPVSRYVNGMHAFFGDLNKDGELTQLIEKVNTLLDKQLFDSSLPRSFAVERYSWANLLPLYISMLRKH